jgi:hypothetical protein
MPQRSCHRSICASWVERGQDLSQIKKAVLSFAFGGTAKALLQQVVVIANNETGIKNVYLRPILDAT